MADAYNTPKVQGNKGGAVESKANLGYIARLCLSKTNHHRVQPPSGHTEGRHHVVQECQVLTLGGVGTESQTGA